MPQELPHNLQKTLLGGFVVKYNYPKCSLVLENPLAESGQVDTCPNCKTQFEVPGSKSKAELERKRQLEKEQADKIAQTKKAQAEERENLANAAMQEEQERRKKLAEQESQIEAEIRQKTRDELWKRIQKNHTGYVYHVERFISEYNNCDENLCSMINLAAEKGWEYIDYKSVQFWDPNNGCLGFLLGSPGLVRTVHLVIFRRPALKDENGDIIPWQPIKKSSANSK
jgi:hypothetical protein